MCVAPARYGGLVRLSARILWGISAAAVCLLLAGAAQATQIPLQDLNSVAMFDVGNTSDTNGLVSWEVDGVEQVFREWFYYRIGDDCSTAEQPIENLGTTQVMAINANFNTGDDVLSLRFTGAELQIDVKFTLAGGQPDTHESDMAEQITLTNLSPGGLTVHFFEYTNFDLGGTPGDDIVRMMNANTVRQGEQHWQASETVITPSSSRYELAYVPAVLTKLQDADADDLAYQWPTVQGTLAGDVSWTFQWDVVLATGHSLTISKDKKLSYVPEPLTMLGMFLGLGSVGAYIRRRRRA